jgi:hypothetical protein
MKFIIGIADRKFLFILIQEIEAFDLGLTAGFEHYYSGSTT